MKLVTVKWKDAYSEDAWTDINDFKEIYDDCQVVITKGFLVHETKGALFVAGSIGQSEIDAACTMVIPKVCVINVNVEGDYNGQGKD